jgi:hypothetical protein
MTLRDLALMDGAANIALLAGALVLVSLGYLVARR